MPDALVLRLDQELRRRVPALPAACRQAFVSSDLAVVHRALRVVGDSGLARGRVFCEWGSGLGAVCTLAASLSYRAHGIEIQPALVEGARELLASLGLPAAFAQGTFLRPGDEALVDDAAHLCLDAAPDAHAALGLDPSACDVVFAFPWPGEEHIYDRLFARHASPGALLLTFHDCSQVLIQRRVDDPDALHALGWVGRRGP